MRRIDELRGLSEDHHHGLVLAQKAKQASSREGDGPLHEVWIEVEEKFRTELEPHFQIEESLMCPALESRGESAPVRRLHEEHRALRACVEPGAGRTLADLKRFGELLEGHIRFEERELFPLVQRILDSEELAAIGRVPRVHSRGTGKRQQGS